MKWKKRNKALQIYWERRKSNLKHWEAYLMSKSIGSGFWKPYQKARQREKSTFS